MPSLIGPIESIERNIRDKIVETFNLVPMINDHVLVYGTERFPGSDEEDETITTVADPNNPNNLDSRITSVIQIAIPRVTESEYAGDRSTQLDFVYPITFDLSVVEWDVTDPLNPWRYASSWQMALSAYLLARQQFKANRTFGFDNVVHDYLQQEDSGVMPNEEEKTLIHAADWSLTVHLLGVTV